MVHCVERIVRLVEVVVSVVLTILSYCLVFTEVVDIDWVSTVVVER